MNRREPADPHRLRNGTCVIAVGLDRHDRGRTLHPPGFDAGRRQAGGPQALAQPRRQRPGFQAKTFDRNLGRLQPSYDRLRFSICLALSKDDAGIIDNADGSLVERYIQAHEVRHGILQVIDGMQRRYSAEPTADRNHPIFMLHYLSSTITIIPSY